MYSVGSADAGIEVSLVCISLLYLENGSMVFYITVTPYRIHEDKPVAFRS